MATLNENARSTPDSVKDIIDTNLTDGQISAFINTAYQLVTQKLSSSGLGDDLLTEIETYLAAHLLSLRDQRVERESIAGEYSATYQGKTGMGLEATLYGQQVLLLDTTGSMAKLGLKKATFEVISEADS